MYPYQPLFTGKNVIFLPETNSTNIDAMDLLAKTNPPEGTCIITDFQTAGKGQIGRGWQSNPGENLLVSFILYPDIIKASDQFYLNMAVSLALVGTLAEYDIAVAIKWPNDIYHKDKKITGILIQNILAGNYIKATVIGIGLNVNQSEFPDNIPNPASMSMITYQVYDIKAVLEKLSCHLEYYYLLLKAGKYRYIKSIYLKNLYRSGIKALYKEADGIPFYGVIQGTDPDGRLVMLKEDGSTRLYMFKEVSYII